MSQKLRSVNTKFWDDGFVVDLTPTEKLLFLYLITNPLTKLVGIYEISLKRIAFDTGLNQQQIEKGFERFEKVRKAFFVDGWIILPNWLKNQNLNSNMKIAVIKEFNELPKQLIVNLINNENKTVSNGYETISNALAMYRKVEDEDEVEIEDKYEDEKIFNFKKELLKLGVEKKIAEDWLTVRKNKKATNTETALNALILKFKESKLTPNECVKISVENSWAGFDIKWTKTNLHQPQKTETPTGQPLTKL